MSSSDFDDNRDLNRDLNRDATRARDTDPRIDPDTGEVIGEAAGGISGALTGAALGSLGGPVGTIIGGIAGAVGGWWAGKAIADAATRITNEDDSYYRTHYESSSARLGDRTYDDVRPAYQLGHLAGQNPDYTGRSFDDIEGDLRRGWTDDVRTRHGDWESVRGYARDAYDRGRLNAGAAAGTATGAAAYGAGRVADKLDDLKDRVDANPASRPGPDATDRPTYGSGADYGAARTADRVDAATDRAGDKIENAWDKTKAGAERLGDKIERGFDNVKDRVDGNPASKPGPDPTDRRI